MPISFDIPRNTPRDIDAIGVPVFTDGAVPRSVGLDRKALVAHGFEAKVGQVLTVPGAGPTVVAVGMGERSSVTTATLRKSAAALARAVAKRTSVATTLASTGEGRVGMRDAAQAVVEGFVLATYKFSRYRSQNSDVGLSRAALVGADERGVRRGEKIAGAVVLARDLVNTPPGDKNARVIAEQAAEVARVNRLQVEILDLEAIKAARLGGILGVNRGSHEEPRLVKLTWEPRQPTGAVALVGKGITFDSGGLSLKTGEGMMSMKVDMGGAAAVLATMSIVPFLRPRVKVIGYLALTDNLPSGNAMKPGDVLTIRNGKTVEVLNTDAEGRLVLADALSLAVEDEVDAIVDLATLTGACIVALGHRICGVMGSSQPLVDQVRAASDRADEATWQLPLPADYRKLLDSEVADLKNIGSTSGLGSGAGGGALTAGLFLKEFTGDIPWVHMDIAGPARVEADDGWLVRGNTGFGVRTLVELLDKFEVPAS